MKKQQLLLILCLSAISFIQAQSVSQQVMSNAGMIQANASTQLNFTLGEPVVGNITNSNTIGQGFWNGAIAEITLSNDDFELATSFAVYPNPVVDRVTVAFKEMNHQNFDLTLTDMNGKQLLSKSFQNTMGKTEIDLSSYTKGIYFLRILNRGSQSTKTIKLIKK